MLAVLLGTTVITGLSSLLFSFGNVRDTLVELGWKKDLASLYTPAVDVSVIGLILVIQYLVTAGIAPERLRKANRLLAGAGLAMLGANIVPSLLTGALNDEPAAYGRAAFDAVLPALLIAWSHVGPFLVSLFREIRSNAEAAAFAIVEERTWATEADRAAAAAALSAARTEASRIVRDATAEAERLRTEASEELAAAASVRQSEAAAAARADRQRRLAADELEDQLAARERDVTRDLVARERSAGTEAAGRLREAEHLRAQADADLAEARRLVASIGPDRDAAASDRRAAEAERRAAAADREAAEEILAAAERAASRSPGRRRDAGDQGDAGDQADRETVTSTSGRLTIDQRVKLWQDKHPAWRELEIPDQKAITDFFPGLKSADTISKFRKRLEELKAA